MLLVAGFTACWYWTSSRNAVATQRLAEEHSSSALPHAAALLAMALTALQLLAGVLICAPIRWCVARTKTAEPVAAAPGWGNRSVLLVGTLHFVGSACTNMSFVHGSASLVQVVKLLEPIETLALMALVNVWLYGKHHGVTASKMLSVLVIVSGTSLLLGQKGMEPNLASVAFALGSGLALASRNVAAKSKHPAAAASAMMSRTPGTGVKTWMSAASEGLLNFSTMTTVACVPAVLVLVLVEGIGRAYGETSMIVWIFRSGPGSRAVIFHALYNMASITVLSLVSAPVHSLLNVGKRIANVLVAAIAFHVPLESSGILGLFVAALGGVMYKYPQMAATQLRKSLPLLLFIIPLASLVTGMFREAVGITEMTRLVGASVDLNAISLERSFGWGAMGPDIAPTPSKFVVWMFPFPPPSNQKELVGPGETLICGYTTGCALQQQVHSDPIAPINLRLLTEHTYFHNYIRDHAFHKTRHFKDFPMHVQAISMLTLLQTWPGACIAHVLWRRILPYSLFCFLNLRTRIIYSFHPNRRLRSNAWQRYANL
jgi:hypothetical protein